MQNEFQFDSEDVDSQFYITDMYASLLWLMKDFLWSAVSIVPVSRNGASPKLEYPQTRVSGEINNFFPPSCKITPQWIKSNGHEVLFSKVYNL